VQTRGMSPVSRGRKNGTKKPSATRPASGRRASRPALSAVPDVRDQAPPPPDDDEADLGALTADMLEIGEALLESDDPLMAEVAGATFAMLDDLTDGSIEATFLEEIMPRLEAAPTEAALAVLLAVASVASGPASAAAAGAADRLAAAGVSRPPWAEELAAPLVAGDFQRRYDDAGAAVFLSCTVERAGRRHAFLVQVDPSACGEAATVLALPAEELPDVLQGIAAAARREKVRQRTETLDAEEFRWQVENALNARAVHDGELSLEDGISLEDDMTFEFGDDEDDGGDDEDAEAEPPYEALALVLRSRLETLPTPRKPPAPHADGDEHDGIDPPGDLAELVRMLDEQGVSPAELLANLTGRGRLPAGPSTRPLPKKPKRAKGRPAPIYQVKVGLRGARPPIWRRLEVPADTSLDRVHAILQAAFGWDDSHLHVFETPYGRFGAPDADLGQRAESPVALQQVLPQPKSKIGYTYDFGDDWEHEIVLEKILDPDPAVVYPRCTGGRRAAPPEDCGGIWGYAALLEILGDPGHPEHDERLDWLGLDNPADLDPAEFDAGSVTAALSRLR